MISVSSEDRPYKEVGERILASIRELGWTNTQFRDEVGYSWTAVNKWFKGIYLPRRGAMDKIAEVLGKSPEWIETGEEPAAEPNEWPSVYRQWLISPEGKAASAKERAYVKTYRSNFEPTPAILSLHLSRERALRPEQFRDE